MDKEQIEQFLGTLGFEIQRRGIGPIRLLLVGGAFMLTQVHNRTVTEDIDIVLKDIDDPTSSHYQQFKAAVQAVATQSGLKKSWLNDVISDFLKDVGPVPEGSLWKTYAGLQVFLPPDEYILAHKVLAGRTKDEDDIRALSHRLGITARVQAHALVDRYIPRPIQEVSNVDETIDIFFV